jgi:hypothetical protein
LGARVREKRPRPRERHGVQRRDRHLRHGVDGLPLPAGFHDEYHEDPGLGPDAPYRERYHDDDHEERGFDDHALNDVQNHDERRLPIRLDLRADRHLPDHLSGHLSGHVSDHLSGRLCRRLSGHQRSHVCGHVSDPVSKGEVGEVGTLPNFLRIRRESGGCNRVGRTPRHFRLQISDWRADGAGGQRPEASKCTSFQFAVRSE